MEMPLRVPVLASQCYSPASDYILDNCHGNVAARQPLGESTGNAQLGGLTRSYARRPGPLASSMTPPILTPPVVPTQSLGPTYGAPPPFPRTPDRHQLQLHARRRKVDINPLWLYWQQFQTYRKKQDEKDDKAGQKWPQVLEDAFLDALLVIPHIGRKKFVVRQTQYGRNMLLGEYLWHAYCASLPPDVEPDMEMLRERKQVSSHIQVLKNIFKNHRCCHIFLPKEVKKAKSADENDLVSLKRHPVLVALSEGRLPDERPNYEYFARILALNNQIVVRPKRCWIFVSRKDVVVQDDGSGYISSTGERLFKEQYPHLERNLEREKWPKEEQQIFKSTMLHEFTKEFSQVESSALRDLSKEWKKPFPDLHQRLEALMAANAQNDILTAEAQLDIIHMQVMLDLNEKRRFPAESELNSWVEINIEKPHLLNHRWRVDTRLVRPAELSYSSSRSAPQLVYETSAEIAIQYQHRPECDGPRTGLDLCHCMSQQNRRDWVTVPFPADVWALTLSNCAEYPAHPYTGMARRRAKKARAAAYRDGDADGDGQSAAEEPQPTQMDLVPKIAMMQEIWSCPPEDFHSGDADSRGSKRWTRRALILWTFRTLHSIDANGKLITADNGKTNWRFLTVLDPVSEYHLQNSLVGASRSTTPSVYGESVGPGMTISPGLPAASRDAIMSPSPTYQQHLNASMSENFSAAWDTAEGIGTLSSAAVQAYNAHMIAEASVSAPAPPANYGFFSRYASHAGLSTPPPTACPTSSFSHSFHANPGGTDHVPSYMIAGVTAAGMVNGSQMLSENIPSVPNGYGSSSSSCYHVPSYGSGHGHLEGWDNATIAGLDSGGWQTGYAPPGTSGMSWPDVGHHGAHHWATTAPTTAATTTSPSWARNPTTTSTAAPPVHGNHSHSHTHSQTWGAASPQAAIVTDKDISQEWEEIDTSSASVTASGLSRGNSQVQGQSQIQMPLSGRDAEAVEMFEEEEWVEGHEMDEAPAPAVKTPSFPQGKKRGRSDSLDRASGGGNPAMAVKRLER